MSNKTEAEGWQEIAVERRLTAAEAEIERLRADNERLRAALKDMIEISRRNGEATQLLWAIGRCAEHAL